MEPLNDTEYEAQRARVSPLFNKWTTMLGLGWWEHFEIEYFRGPLPSLDTIGESIEAAMDIVTSWQYLQAHVRVCLPEVKGLSDDRIEYMVVHELMHALVNETRADDWTQERRNHEERVCTQLALAMRRVFDHRGLEEP